MSFSTNLWQTLPLLLLLSSHAFADDFISIAPQFVQESSAAATINFPDNINSDLTISHWIVGGGDSPKSFVASEKGVACSNPDSDQIQNPVKERHSRLRKRAEDEFCSWQRPQNIPSSVHAPTQETGGTGTAGSTQQPDEGAQQQKLAVPSENSGLDTDLLSNSPCRNAGSIRPIGLASMVDLQVPVCHLFGDKPGSGRALESWLPICRHCEHFFFLSQSVVSFRKGHWIPAAIMFGLRLTVYVQLIPVVLLAKSFGAAEQHNSRKGWTYLLK